MVTDSRYAALFQPIQIGPVTAPNRFYQVPHASGMTEANPRVRAAFRYIASTNPSLYRVIDADRDIAEVSEDIRQTINAHFSLQLMRSPAP